MHTNLDPEYVEFVKASEDVGNGVGFLVQGVIDRMQYSPGFLKKLQTLVSEYDSPFHTSGVIRRLKEDYIKTQANDTKSFTGNN